MADEIDNAQRVAEQLDDAILNNYRRGMRNAMEVDDAPRDCEDCGEPIPEPRRKAQPGCTRCVKCQEQQEQLLAHWRQPC